MEKYNLFRQVDIFNNKTSGLVEEIKLDNFDLKLMKSRFFPPPIDPMMYNPYEINSSMIDLFPAITFNFKKYSYYLACYRSWTRSEIEIFTIKKNCKKEYVDRLIRLLKSNRTKFLQSLSHNNFLELSLFTNLINNEKATIIEKANKMKINQAYIISDGTAFDRKQISIEQCINSVISNGFSNLIIFGDSDFVYFEGEGKNNRWLSK